MPADPEPLETDPPDAEPPDTERTEPFDTGLAPGDLDPARPQPYETPWGTFSLYVVDGNAVAADSWCPHMQGPLYEGSVANGRVTCPWHSWVFSLETGRCVWAPEGAASVDAVVRLCSVSIGTKGTYRIHPPANAPAP